MGTVYLARDTRAGKAAPGTDQAEALLALKVLPPKRAREEETTLLRFRREMELGQLLAHPNVTRTFDAGLIGGIHYIAMEYVPGESLKRLVSRVGPLSAAEAAPLFADIAAGLTHAHERGLIHRDLKPSNVMVTPEGRAKILDLGLALLMHETLPADRAIVGGEGYILGTMDYIAPEQGTDATNVGPRSDLYSLGCTLYFTVTGVPPFPGGTPQQKIRWHKTEPPPAVRSINPAVPIGFAELVEKLLAKEPEERPGSAEEVRQSLLPWIGEPKRLPVNQATSSTSPDVMQGFDTPEFDPSLWEAAPTAATGNSTAEEMANRPVQADAPATEPSLASIATPSERRVWLYLLIPAILALLFVLLRGR
jgi:serine/threonine protein kinase